MRYKMEKPQSAMVISFVACDFFLWFDLTSYWSSDKVNKCQS